MMSFILARTVRALVVLFLTVTFVFIVLRLSGDPAEQILSDVATPEALAAFRINWGLDKSILEQFLIYWSHAIRGDFGTSFADGREVFAVIAERVPKTLLVTVSAFVLSMLIGIPAGILAAVRRETASDKAVMAGAVLGYSVPNFLLGLALIFIFAVWLRVLPSSGSSTFKHAILPIATFALFNAAGVARFTRSTLIDVLGQPYIAAARADGVPEWDIILRHALPNAAIPMVTMLGFIAGGLLGGAALIEPVFGWPGLGSGFVRATSSGDLNVVQAMIILFTAFMVTINLIVDILYAVLNPKIRLQSNER
ncbi:MULTISPECIES: ABC transporter permease [Rhizobium/Agrobacterium group]|uniref:ABC transporter permease n=1 Tax=Rhizobium/Agrobacterium group TaxID=227290 RepID=UPI000621E9B2|nr:MULTISPECIES: ABC transporter permease [Rhizobium/Agrobacterium group]MBY5836308.1 ABC transporter permease [Rhizobium leguminosarum]MVA27108.1 ABC transporter permease subunit [Agrobacterium vitis]NKM79000.1 ABC transporter permease subunit [Rhizobium leguminosarum bv. viciae]QSZ08625.1 ABC transporter permease [Rhizobium leguminosarum]CDZ55571.1 Glutathione transport system permease protein GsiC [Neorhizobium galegae bv. orientalis]